MEVRLRLQVVHRQLEHPQDSHPPPEEEGGNYAVGIAARVEKPVEDAVDSKATSKECTQAVESKGAPSMAPSINDIKPSPA